MYKLKGFILLVSVVSLLVFNNTGVGGPIVCGLAQSGPLNFKPIAARFLLSKFGPCPVHGPPSPCSALLAAAILEVSLEAFVDPIWPVIVERVWLNKS